MLDRVVIGEHGDDGITMADIRGPLSHHGAICRKLVSLGTGAIVDCETMASFHQAARHRATHAAETNEPDLHGNLAPYVSLRLN
jgi:hypothetical protein